MLRKACLALLVCSCFPAITWGQDDLTGGRLLRFLAGTKLDFSRARSLPYMTTDQVRFENVIAKGEHYVLLTRWNRINMMPMLLHHLGAVQIPYRTIPLGSSDWSGIPPVMTDPQGDKDPSAPGAGTDLAAVYFARDSEYVYFRMTLYDGAPIANCAYVVEFTQYQYQLHTPGDVLVMVDTNANHPWLVQVYDRGPGSFIDSFPEDHVAVGTNYIEWKVPITALQFPPNTPYQYFPPAPLGPQGVENCFVRVYIHPEGAPGENVPLADEENHPSLRPLVVNFYSNPTP